ncbi:MAG TPA: class I SAM-dependent methyltransferase [Patescibacteria group bacterium]|nr:class I SAM-dependent methyltransferase [Patescibacteria group bacterium]
MQRIPEPELMEDMAQAEAYDRADFSAAHGARVELFAARYAREVTGSVLDLGCGSGDILERFAKKYPRAQFVGVDGSFAMLELSRRRMMRANIAERMDFVEALIPAGDIPLEDYEVVMSHSLLHQLHQPEVLWRTISQVAPRHSFIFVADLRRPQSTAEAEAIVDRLSPNEPEVLRRDFYNSLCAAFTKEELQQQLNDAGLLLRVEEVGEIHVLAFGERC